MTGLEALQALREGKKVTNSTMTSYFAVVLTARNHTAPNNGYPYKRIAWVPAHEADEDLVEAWCAGDPFDGSEFLVDDWEVVE